MPFVLRSPGIILEDCFIRIDGQMRRFDRQTKRFTNWHPGFTNGDYLVFSVKDPRTGKRADVQVALVVALSFNVDWGDSSTWPGVTQTLPNHKDGNHFNNHPDNIDLVSYRENAEDGVARRHRLGKASEYKMRHRDGMARPIQLQHTNVVLWDAMSSSTGGDGACIWTVAWGYAEALEISGAGELGLSARTLHNQMNRLHDSGLPPFECPRSG